MSRLREIRATFDCDGCGCPFSVRIDGDAKLSPEAPTIYDLAVDSVRGGLEYQDKTKLFMRYSSVDGDKCFCHDCTAENDRKKNEDSEQ